jgi:TIGR03009 family protein
MPHTTQYAPAVALMLCGLFTSAATAQSVALPQQTTQQQVVAQQPALQLGVPQPAAIQPPAVQAPEGFQLNALQLAQLNQVLATWQQESGKITTFKCAFERLEYDVAFGPGPDIPLNRNKGDLSFGKPDKGSFRITEINTWQADPIAPGQQPPAQATGKWVPQPDKVGEHWVCDGKSIFEYRHDNKQLVERPIPANLQGQAIADGPLPFLFGADPQKLQARYWLRVEQQANQNQIWLTAKPRFQAQAADFQEVNVILDRGRMLPTHMQVRLPNGSRHVYIFDVIGASINNPIARLQNWFQLPRLPAGWKRVVEQMPVEQAAQPAQPPR